MNLPAALITNHFRSAARFRIRAAFLLALFVALRLAQTGGQAAVPTNALPYTTGYLLTGDYAVGSVNLVPGNNNTSTGTIHMSGVPDNADVVAAFVYWETIAPVGVDPVAIADFVKFRGEPIKSVRVKSKKQPLAAACFLSGGPWEITMFRADVKRLLPPQLDVNGKSIGKLLVNDGDLQENNLPLTTVTLPTGNLVSDSAGASLVVVYRDRSLPLKKVVLYDGLRVAAPAEETTQAIAGFYQSGGAPKKAKLTHIVGSSASNSTEALWFNNTKVKTNPFQGTASLSDRAWSDVTVDVSSLMNQATVSPVYGETVTSKVTHTSNNPYECLTYEATLFSVTVLDADKDGIPDRLEQPSGLLKDPNNVELPNLYAMGARLQRRDFFGEVNAMRTLQDTTYGSPNAPYDSGVGPDGIPGTADDTLPPVVSVTAPPHNHMPIARVLTDVGNAMKAAPVANLDGTTGIWAHFDVGNLGAYHGLGADYSPSVGSNDEYLVPDAYARGGELTIETACLPGPNCRFPDYPGTVGWGFSLTQYMLGQDVEPAVAPRFDENRNGLVHYLLYPHLRGKPRAMCVNPDGSPDLDCEANNPDFHVAWSSSGVSALPGDRAIISLGRWDNFVGTPFMVASTTLHEIGHQWELYHGGARPTFIEIPGLDEGWSKRVFVYREPQCKPNHASAMSYLFQVLGQLDNAGKPHLDFSRNTNLPLDETLLRDVAVSSQPLYRTSWFVPLVEGTSAFALGTPAAKKFCGGRIFPDPLPAGWVPMGRVDAPSVSAPIDWNTDGTLKQNLFPLMRQDVNFDGDLNGLATIPPAPPLLGFNDWANIRLDQMGGGHFMGDVSVGGEDFGGEDFGGEDFGGEDFGGEDFGGEDFGGEDFGGEDFGGVDVDGEDFGGQDRGGEDFGGDGEADLEDAEAIVGAKISAPTEFNACVLGGNLPAPRPGVGTPACVSAPEGSPLHRTRLTWKAPIFGTPEHYLIIRATGPAVTDDNQVLVGTLTPGAAGCAAPDQVCSFVDPEALPDARQFTYIAKAQSDDEETGPASDPKTITARNDAPIAVGDARSTNEDTTLTSLLSALVNDGDADGANLAASLVAGFGPTHGTLVQFGSDGTFTYQPNPNFNGTDSFSYKLLGGTWPCSEVPRGVCDPLVPLSADSAGVTVTITVNAVNDRPTANAQFVSTAEGTPKAITLTATDIETAPANLSGVITQGPAHGTLTGTWPTYTYTPNPEDADFNGGDSFRFTVTDRGDPDNCATIPTPAQGCSQPLTSDEAIVDVTVTAVNDAPVAVGDSKSTSKNRTLVFPALDLTANDSPGPGNENLQILTVTAVAATENTHGTVSLEEATITYVPAAGFTGLARFNYTVQDNGTTNGAADPKSAVGEVVVSVVEKAIVVSQSSNSVHVLDLSDYTIESTTALNVGIALDVATTPDGQRAVVTSFDGKVVFLDMTVSPPTIVRTITTPIPNEDVHIALSPAGYTLIADGAPNSQIVSVDIATGIIVTALTVPYQAQGITALPDQGIVLVNSFGSICPTGQECPPTQFQGPGQVHVLNLAANGVLSDPELTLPTGGDGAINVTVSPDGRLALVANFVSGTIGILRINADGNVTFDGVVSSTTGFSAAQSIAFSPDGSHAYVNQVSTPVIVAVLNIDSEHTVRDSGSRIGLEGSSGNALFGVDQIATGPAGTVLVHVRATSADADGFVAVIDPVTNSVITTIPIPNDHQGGGIAVIP